MAIMAGIIVVVGLIVGISVKLYFGDTVKERMAEDLIEKVVQVESGIDIEPIIDMETAVKKATKE